MASRQNKISIDVAADTSSNDSFSFAGLVCIQEQQAKSLQCNGANRVHQQSAEFEFSTVEDSFVCDPIKHSPADLLISNGQILPQPIKLQPSQDTVSKQKRTTASVRATSTGNKRSIDNSNGSQASAIPYPEHTNRDKEKAGQSSWFGQKLFKSFFFPCKETQAVKPAALRADRTPSKRQAILA